MGGVTGGSELGFGVGVKEACGWGVGVKDGWGWVWAMESGVGWGPGGLCVGVVFTARCGVCCWVCSTSSWGGGGVPRSGLWFGEVFKGLLVVGSGLLWGGWSRRTCGWGWGNWAEWLWVVPGVPWVGQGAWVGVG